MASKPATQYSVCSVSKATPMTRGLAAAEALELAAPELAEGVSDCWQPARKAPTASARKVRRGFIGAGRCLVFRAGRGVVFRGVVEDEHHVGAEATVDVWSE